jgi:short-subunit dehydrogenase
MEQYDGKVALVTGASRGLGRHIAMELAGMGCSVAVTARTIESLDDVATRITAQTSQIAVAVPGDLTVAADRVGIQEQVETQLGPIDILINAAAIAKSARFVDEDPTRVLVTNLEAPIQLTRLVAHGMISRGYGRVMNVASLAGQAGLPFAVDYSASKAGLIGFSLALREELRGTGVSVTVVSPGFIVDEGMYVPYQTPVPWYLGSNYSAVVARKAVEALRKNRAEVVVNRMPLRPLLVLGAASERSMRGFTRFLGATSYLRGLAEKRLPYSDSPELTRPERATSEAPY